MKRTERLNYKLLATTGEKVIVEENCEVAEKEVDDLSILIGNWSMNDTEEMPSTDGLNQIVIEESGLSDDIDDFLEENDLHDTFEVVELEKLTLKVEQLRSAYRIKHKELQAGLGNDYEPRFGKMFAQKINAIKDYIKQVKEMKRKIKANEDVVKQSEADMKVRSLKFLLNEVVMVIENLEETFQSLKEDESDKEIQKRRDELPAHTKLLQKLGGQFKELLENPHSRSDGMTNDINLLNKRYDKLIYLKNEYALQVKEEANKREIDKFESFEASVLNIKLSKFNGYGSALDIYTFQSMFEKLHLKSTPRKLLPDLLKNNFLDNPALMLVKNIEDIDDVWKRLKDAYGDCKIMLKKKLSEVSNLDVLWRIKDPEKITEGLAKIINAMKDLLSLSKKHGIERKLFHGDALDRIYVLLGDGRVTRWLSLGYDKNWEDEELWNNLIEFLEKDLKIHQQKLLIQGKNQDKKYGATAKESKNNERRGSAYLSDGNYYSKDEASSNISSDHVCSICGEKNHVATYGPGGCMLIQYFACKKFVEMSPAERFAELRKKGLCYQCLYPGAQRNQGKHKEGRCQRDFCCKHPSHDVYPKKFHVLVCNQHKENAENKDLLESYKQRCIMKKSSILPQYSKNIQLSYATYLKNHVGDESKMFNERAIYMLQSIEVNNQLFNIFYDSGCCDFVSRYDAIKKLGSCATKEYDGPVELGGVGGISSESPHGIYSVRLPLINGNNAEMSGICLDQITKEFPIYPIAGEVEEDIKDGYQAHGFDPKNLPKLPEKVGGHVDFMIGIKYLRYFPEKVFQLPSGLSIYKSHFKNSDGSSGVIGGPHGVFTEIERYHHLGQALQSNFVSNQYQLFKIGYQMNPDISFLGFKEKNQYDVIENKENHGEVFISRQMKVFEQVKEAVE